MDLIDALTRLLSALAATAAVWVAADKLVTDLARLRSVDAEPLDTPDEGHVPQ